MHFNVVLILIMPWKMLLSSGDILWLINYFFCEWHNAFRSDLFDPNNKTRKPSVVAADPSVHTLTKKKKKQVYFLICNHSKSWIVLQVWVLETTKQQILRCILLKNVSHKSKHRYPVLDISRLINLDCILWWLIPLQHCALISSAIWSIHVVMVLTTTTKKNIVTFHVVRMLTKRTLSPFKMQLLLKAHNKCP